jgi:hypothetical protein
VLINSPDEIATPTEEEETLEHDDSASDPAVVERLKRYKELRGRVQPMTTRGTDPEGRWLVDCSIAYGGELLQRDAGATARRP